MKLKVKVKVKNPIELVTCCPDIKEAANSWEVGSLEVEFKVRSHEIFRKFTEEMKDTKVCLIDLSLNLNDQKFR